MEKHDELVTVFILKVLPVCCILSQDTLEDAHDIREHGHTSQQHHGTKQTFRSALWTDISETYSGQSSESKISEFNENLAILVVVLAIWFCVLLHCFALEVRLKIIFNILICSGIHDASQVKLFYANKLHKGQSEEVSHIKH